MGRPVIALPDVSDTATIEASSEVGAFSATNLFRPQPFDVWRTAGTTEYLVLDFGAPSPVQLIWLGYTNATNSATWRIRAAASEAALTAGPWFDSGVISHWPSPHLVGWERTHALLWIVGPQSLRWWRIDIDDPTNPAGYYQAGRLYISAAWQSPRGADFGVSVQVIDPTKKTRTRSGNLFINRHGPYREIEFTLSFLPEAAMFENAFPVDLRRARARDLLAVLDPEATDRIMDQTIYGTMRDLSPIESQILGFHRKRFRIEEWELP